MSIGETQLRDRRATIEPSAYRSGRREAWRRLRQHKAALVGIAFIVVLAVVAIVHPLVSSRSYADQDLLAAYQRPGDGALLGTDALGRDVLTRLLYGARISLTVALFAEAIQLFLGVPIGLIAGYFGGRVDSVLMRLVDVFFAFPLYLFVVVLATFLKVNLDEGGTIGSLLSGLDTATSGLLGVLIAVSLVFWLIPARLVRGVVLQIMQSDYVKAARSMGAPTSRIIVKHVLPNAMGPVIVAATLGVPAAILVEAGISFLGLGVDPPTPSWGIMLSEGVDALSSYPHLVIAPCLALVCTMLAFTFLGDGLRDALDPMSGDE